MRVSIITFGCKVNQYESEFMAEMLESNGFIVVPSDVKADIYIINSCAVTNEAERKLRQYVRRLKRENPSSKVIVVGCYSQLKKHEILSVGADASLGNAEKKDIVKYIAQLNGKPLVSVNDLYWLKDMLFETVKGGYAERTRAYIKIEDGCDRSCTYCAIRLARGTKVRSKPLDLVIREVENLVKKGYKEIVITGINIGRYGKDNGESLAKLIHEIEKIDGDFRYRLSSLNPEDVTEDILEAFKVYEKICPHLHLSLQSGSDKILERMQRYYRIADYLRIVSRLRNIDPMFSITTDIIVGFPGESTNDFEKSLEIIRKVKFSRVHVFRFSPKAGTLAARMKDQIPGNVKKERAEELERVAREVAKEYRESSIGCKRRVLVEKTFEGLSSGYDEYYIHHEFYGGKKDEFKEVIIRSVSEDGVISKGVDISKWVVEKK